MNLKIKNSNTQKKYIFSKEQNNKTNENINGERSLLGFNKNDLNMLCRIREFYA